MEWTLRFSRRYQGYELLRHDAVYFDSQRFEGIYYFHVPARKAHRYSFETLVRVCLNIRRPVPEDRNYEVLLIHSSEIIVHFWNPFTQFKFQALACLQDGGASGSTAGLDEMRTRTRWLGFNFASKSRNFNIFLPPFREAVHPVKVIRPI
jgi:hypothetical protein